MLALILASTLTAVAGTPAAPLPDPAIVTGATQVHDPSMLVRPSGSPRYVVYGTHNATLTSGNRIAFRSGGPYFPVTPAWWRTYNNGDVWSPDVSFHNGTYWMYYAVSGAHWHAAIGVATSSSGLPGTWTDRGPVIGSDAASVPAYTAIDPNLLVDSSDHWWLTFGSYRTGIYMIALDPATGHLARGYTLHHLAQRNRPIAGDTIEAAFVYPHDGAYYLFTSWDHCCEGVASTYSIHVGRATCPTCHYYDESGRDLLDGGGTPVLASHGYVRGPGGESVVFDDSVGAHDLLVYHYYDARHGGIPSLGIDFLAWDSRDFPYAY